MRNYKVIDTFTQIISKLKFPKMIGQSWKLDVCHENSYM